MRPWQWTLILLAAVGLVFGEVRRLDFVDYDDNINVYANPRLNPVSLHSLAEIWTQPYFALYIPLTHTVWAAVASVSRGTPNARGITLDPAGFHLANLLVHAVSALVVLSILRRLMGNDWGAFVGAALFAMHPVQVEPVCWVTGMKDLLAGMLALAALAQHLRGAELSAAGTGRPWRHLALATVLFALALLAKPTVVMLPLIAWALDHLVVGRDARRAAGAVAPWLPLAVVAGVLARLHTGAEPEAAPLWARPLVAGDALAFYLSKLVWPCGLCVDYQRTPAVVLAHWWGYVTWLLPAALTVALILGWRRRPVLAAAGITFAAALLPVLGLVPFPDQDVSDRYLYLAMLGPALAAGVGAARLRQRWSQGLSLAALTALAALSTLQTVHWSNTATLFMRVLAVNPNSYVAHTMLANERLNEGKNREAYAHAQQALALKPDYVPALQALGRCLLLSGDAAGAAEAYGRAVQLEPQTAITHFALGNALAAGEDLEAARAQYQEAVRLDPQAWYAHENLALVLLRLGQTEEAVAHLRECVRLRPDYQEARQSLAAALRLLGRDEEAAAVQELAGGQ